ncbi:MAG: hypothetical protein KAI47_18270, partial [Deltaproteobacteria bacterium]|nr:hypothetical protein [Deltaproteobacteria bacterium]
RLVSPFVSSGLGLVTSGARLYRDLASTGPLIILAFLAFLVLVRASPPEGGVAFLALATLVVYVLARVFAFKLYAPQRYGAYGLPMVTIVFAAMTLGRLGSRLPAARRHVLRNGAATFFILALWAFAGSGVRQPPADGMTLSGRAYPSHLRVDPRIKVKSLYPALRRLPEEARVAAHPIDANDISLWSGRAATPSYETLQPWFSRSWQRLRTGAERTLTALYATRRETVLAFCARDHVTHLLVNRDRYGTAFRRKAKLFEPLGGFVARLLRDIPSPEAFVLARVPPATVVWHEGLFILVDCAKLREAWGP